MIIVNTPLYHNEIIDLLESSEDQFKFVKKEGIKLYFETHDDEEKSAAKAKELIKGQKYGSNLLFKVKTEEYI